MAGLRKRLDALLVLGDVLAGEPAGEEEAVVAVGARIAHGLAVDGHHSLPALAGALGDELLEPRARGSELRAEEQGELVGALARATAGDGAEADREILVQRDSIIGGERDALGFVEELFHFQTEERRGNEAEVRERAVAAADVLRIRPGPPEAFLLGEILQRSTRIGNRHEVASTLAARKLRAEVPVEGIDLGGGAALRRDEEERLREVEALDGIADRVGGGGVEDPQVEAALLLSEDAGEDVGAEGGAAHPEHDAMAELLRSLLGEVGNLEQLVAHLYRDVEPSEAALRHCLVLGIVAPDGRVLRPEALRDLLLLGDAQSFLRRVALLPELLVNLHRAPGLLRDGPALHRAQEPVEGLGEEVETVVGELLANLLEIDPGLSELRELGARLVDALDDGVGDLAVIVERQERRERHGVDGVLADERLDVEDVAVGLVLGPGRSPERPLTGGALRFQLLPAIRPDGLQIGLVRLLGVRHRNLSQQILVALLLEKLVHRAVHAADEEARHAVDLRNR